MGSMEYIFTVIAAIIVGTPSFSSAIYLYGSSLKAGLQDSIQYPHSADVCKSLPLSQDWCVYAYECIGEYL